MVEAVLTPAHPHALETLLDQPFAGTLNHPTANGQSQSLVYLIVDVVAMPLQIGIHCAHGLPRRVRQTLYVQGVGKVCQDPVGLTMPQPVPGPAPPPARLGGAAIQPGSRPLPQLLYRVVKVEDAPRIVHEALVKQPP